jgi:phosphatidylserine/phosphatidylglycerophosphate/cardiolipin synthase-like enzyme
VILALLLSACAPSQEDIDGTRGGRVDAYFNDPGTRRQNLWEPDAIDVMIETIRNARSTIDMAVMGFNRRELVDALEMAWDRGVQIRMVGDASHVYNSGYTRFRDRHIPLVTGNSPHIMHDKFMVVDGRFVFGGTANWTDSDLRLNSNNFFLIDSGPIAEDFTVEFNQMFEGRFGAMKTEIDNGRVYQVGDTTVEVWFAPNEDAMGRILELVDAAQESVRFTIFAFTKDTLGSALVRKHEEILAGAEVDESLPIEERPGVMGVIDQSQLHSNGQYHEVYRLLGAGIPLRLDGNDNGEQPGDYQAGGGRLHSKTMVIDADGENPIVITGSFNWSASATQSNDEYLLVFRGGRLARTFADYFKYLWESGRQMGEVTMEADDLQPGDITINEVMWYGVTAQDPDGLDEFLELRNHTDRDLRIDLWQIANANDVVVGFPPGSLLPAGGLFTVLDHTMEPYRDGVPQDEPSAFQGGDMVVNAFNDNRQARLYLKDGQLDLRLLDPKGTLMDRAGNGGPAFAGGPGTADGRPVSRSMERLDGAIDGTLPESWQACALTEGGEGVTPAFRAAVIASPGETNSPPP